MRAASLALPFQTERKKNKTHVAIYHTPTQWFIHIQNKATWLPIYSLCDTSLLMLLCVPPPHTTLLENSTLKWRQKRGRKCIEWDLYSIWICLQFMQITLLGHQTAYKTKVKDKVRLVICHVFFTKTGSSKCGDSSPQFYLLYWQQELNR